MQAKIEEDGLAKWFGAISRKRNELVGLPGGRINNGQFQMSNRSLVPVLDSAEYSRQILQCEPNGGV
jgi:hypothetical protein